MIDIHCHILYGVDDGSDCLSESVEMARIASECGTKTIIATPHANIPGMDNGYWSTKHADALNAVNKALADAGIDVTVCQGQEVFSFGDITDKLHDGALITLNGSRYLLIEFDFEERSDHIISRCSDLFQMGLVPVVAHPERYRVLQQDYDTVFALKEMGCLFQLNKGSLFGSFGERARAAAHRFLSDTMADFIASDAHSPYMRTPYVLDAHEMVTELYSPDYADFLFSDNPALLLADKEILPF